MGSVCSSPDPALRVGGQREGHPGLHRGSWSNALNLLWEEGPDNPPGLVYRAGAIAELI